MPIELQRPGQQGRSLDGMNGQDRNHVCADTEKSRMPQAHHATEPQHEIETYGSQGVYQDPAEKRHQIRFIRHAGKRGQRHKQGCAAGYGNGSSVHCVSFCPR